MNRKQAIDGITDVKKIFSNHGIDIWLDMGTLLGAVREGELIGWDNDIDFAVWHEDIIDFDVLNDSFRKRGYSVKLYTNKILIKNKDCDIDVYLHRKRGTSAVNFWYRPSIKWSRLIWKYPLFIHLIHLIGLSPNSNLSTKNYKFATLSSILLHMIHLIHYSLRLKIILALEKITFRYFILKVPETFFNNLQKIEFYGIEHQIPNNVSKYLSARYGKSWEIPKKKWGWTLQMNSEIESKIIDPKEIYNRLDDSSIFKRII